MAGEKKKDIPKLRLARKQNDERSHEPATKPADAEVDNEQAGLSLKNPMSFPTDNIDPSSKIQVVDLLDVAYAPSRIQAKRARRVSLVKKFLAYSLTFLSVVMLTYVYAHLIQRWSYLSPLPHYIPFLTSAFLSTVCLVYSYKHLFVVRERSLSLSIFSLIVSLTLGWWNIQVLDVVANPESRAPDNVLWEPLNSTEMLAAYELNAALGASQVIKDYANLSLDQYKKAFLRLPQSEWKPYFIKHLSPEEMSRVKIHNIDLYLVTVCERMQQKRTEQWQAFIEVYENPPFLLRLKQACLLPYTGMLRLL